MQVELVTIEMKKTKKGDGAIQLVFKSDDGDWIREWIGLDIAPDFVWERWGKCRGISDDANSVKVYLTQVGTAFNVIGSRCEVTCEEEDYQGKTYLKIKEANPVGVEAPAPAPAPLTLTETSGVADDEIPF